MARLNVASGAGGAAGVGGTVALRQFVDQTGDNSIMRPSVLYGVGLGGASLLAWVAMRRRMVPGSMMMQDVAMAFGVTGLVSGVSSAVLPKGAGLSPQLPTL